MKKVIVKCKLADRDVFEAKLDDIELDFSPIYWLHDRVYIPREYKKGTNYPRLSLRTETHSTDGAPTYSLILHRHIEDSGVDIVEEAPITDYAGMVNIIFQLGFKLAGEVSRRRQTLDMGEGTLIHLDVLDGSNEAYAKIESTITDKDSVIEAKTDLKRTFAALGEKDIVESAYFEI